MSAILQALRRRTVKSTASVARPIGTDGAYAYSSPSSLILPDSINEREMSAEFVVVSNVEDRENDVIEPKGCLEYLAEYRANPVVLLEHDCLAPIGTSADKDGTLHFRVLDDQIIAKCFFHGLPLRGENLSEEVFHLVVKGVFKGASPGFLPIKARKRGYAKDAGYCYDQWRLTEWSITTQPINQGALRLSLSGRTIRHKSLRHMLEKLLVKSAPMVVGGWGTETDNMKPKTAKIEFDNQIFADQAACVAWLDAHGFDSSVCVPLPSSFIFNQRDGVANAGQKSLGRGVVALLTKAFGKEKADDEDEDEKKKKKPADDEKADMDEDKIEKATDADDEDDTDDESSDAETDATEDDEASDEGEEAEGEAAAEDEAPADPEALKAEAQDLANVVTHFKTLLAALPEMTERASKMGEQYTKIAADADALVADLSAAFGEHFSSVALDSMASKAADELAPTPEAAPMDDPDVVKALQSLHAARKSMDNAIKVGKTVPRVCSADRAANRIAN